MTSAASSFILGQTKMTSVAAVHGHRKEEFWRLCDVDRATNLTCWSRSVRQKKLHCNSLVENVCVQ